MLRPQSASGARDPPRIANKQPRHENEPGKPDNDSRQPNRLTRSIRAAPDLAYHEEEEFRQCAGGFGERLAITRFDGRPDPLVEVDGFFAILVMHELEQLSRARHQTLRLRSARHRNPLHNRAAALHFLKFPFDDLGVRFFAAGRAVKIASEARFKEILNSLAPSGDLFRSLRLHGIRDGDLLRPAGQLLLGGHFENAIQIEPHAAENLVEIFRLRKAPNGEIAHQYVLQRILVLALIYKI